MASGPNNVRKRVPEGSPIIRWALITVALGFLLLFLVVPLLTVFYYAFRKGVAVYFQAFQNRAVLSAVVLTLVAALVSVVLNVIFGIAAAWTITKFDFKGKSFLTTLIDLPFTVSPVIAGLIFVLMFGAQSQLGAWLIAHQIKIVYAIPGIILATVFVTFPFVARELIPLMEAQGREEEEAAFALGAGGWATFWRITAPNIKWGLLYSVILCNARAMGEFGAVSVVSGHIRCKTNTLPLHVEILYSEYNFSAAFAVASLLAMLAIVTLIIKQAVEWRSRRSALALASDDAERLIE